jgi:hypothetical protein
VRQRQELVAILIEHPPRRTEGQHPFPPCALIRIRSCESVVVRDHGENHIARRPPSCAEDSTLVNPQTWIVSPRPFKLIHWCILRLGRGSCFLYTFFCTGRSPIRNIESIWHGGRALLAADHLTHDEDKPWTDTGSG